MPLLQIKHHKTGTVLFQGSFASARAAVEEAVRRHTDLAGADLRHANLAHAMLDDARLARARLDGANLTGANLSEAQLDGACFEGAALQAACLCFSTLRGCDFRGARFGGTDIAGCDMSGGWFSALSSFSLNFIDAHALADCRYQTCDGGTAGFSRPPVVIGGLPLPVALLDTHMLIGNTVRPFDGWLRHTNDNRSDSTAALRAETMFRQYNSLFAALLDRRAAA